MESNNYRVPAVTRLAIIFWIAALLSLAGCAPGHYQPRYGAHYTKQQVKLMKAIERCPAHLRK